MTQPMPVSDSHYAERGKPELKLFVNDDDAAIAEHRLARCVYAETLVASLPEVEQLCAMLGNTGRPVEELAADGGVFESLSKSSERHWALLVDSRDAGFQMVLRTVRRMKAGLLEDKIYGATRFHRDDMMPEWAASTGSVAEVGRLLFYL
ncbi:MAG: hypothetical protein LBL21_02295 [Rickettsiales bacterium]|jgi:hypothetical protein|nr:hypothetical protein [Rickettsiales bacterium]